MKKRLNPKSATKGEHDTTATKRQPWLKLLVAFVLGGGLIAILDLPAKIVSFKNVVTGVTPVERVVQTETPRSISDDLKLILADVNPESLSQVDRGGVVVPLTVNQKNLDRLEKLNAVPGFSEIARLRVDRTSTIMNGVGKKGRFNDVHPSGQLVPVDVELLRPIR